MNAITYQQALEHLYKSYSGGGKAGLDGVKAVLRRMGCPQEKVPVIHVAGTNGKGSVCAFLQHILTAAGFKTGTFTSPHLHRYNERIAVNSKPVSDDDFARLMTSVAEAANEAAPAGRLSFFEILTCMAYVYFAEEKADFAIIETGIGGRLDSTNVIESPLLSVITAPGHDHREILGDTLAQIAAEDAGIIKKGCPVAVYPTSELPIFIEKAENSPLYYIGDELSVTDLSYSLQGTDFSASTRYFSYRDLSIRLLGEHQVQNAVHALLCTEALRECRNLRIPDEAVRRGLAECRWPGRFEPAAGGDGKPLVVLDGAHNEDGARILAEAVKRYFPGRRVVLLIGISRHKDSRSILRRILPVADAVVCTCASFRAMPAEELAALAEELSGVSATAMENRAAASEAAMKIAGPEGAVVIAGSLYLVGDLRSVFCDGL